MQTGLIALRTMDATVFGIEKLTADNYGKIEAFLEAKALLEGWNVACKETPLKE